MNSKNCYEKEKDKKKETFNQSFEAKSFSQWKMDPKKCPM